MITKREIKKVQKWLPSGYIKDIAANTNYSESTVEKFFCGIHYNKTIHECAVALAERNKEDIESLKQRIEVL